MIKKLTDDFPNVSNPQDFQNSIQVGKLGLMPAKYSLGREEKINLSIYIHSTGEKFLLGKF